MIVVIKMKFKLQPKQVLEICHFGSRTTVVHFYTVMLKMLK
jgi:hypothetical protein